MFFKLKLKRSYTEAELVTGCVANDRHFQELFYKKYFPPMLSMAYRYTSDENEAIHIVNDGFLRVFKKIHLYKAEGSLEGWVRRVVFHALADYFKEKNKSLHFLVIEEDTQTPIIPPEVVADLDMNDLMRLIDINLTEMTKKVFLLYALEGYTHNEISEKLSMSIGTSKWHVSNARTILKSIILAKKEII